jgi:hypothetical protein
MKYKAKKLWVNVKSMLLKNRLNTNYGRRQRLLLPSARCNVS